MKMPLRIYNRFLDFQAEIDTYQSLQFGRNFHGVADFELHINRYMHETKHLEKGNLVALNKQRNKVGIILTKEIALDDSGKDSENFKLTGYTIDGIMGRRLTVPPGHTSHDRKSGNAETVMKHYVYNHFVNPVDPSRKMPHVEVAPDHNRGEHIEWESRYKNIADELETISIKTGLGWGLFANFKTKKLIFDVIEAKDLTQDNPYGNHPVFFSPEFETIKSQGFINSDNDLRNVGYVGGQGEGAEREIITLGNNAGWDRIETFIDARDVGSTEDEGLSPEEIKQQLKERGQSKMRDMESIYTLEAEILTPSQESPFQYGEDFDIGDKVQVINKSWGLQMTAPITHFKEIHETSGFRLEATFGRSRPTLISKMKSKFDELQGVEKQELPALIAVETKQYTNRKVQQEEQERIEQAKQNLEESKKHTEEYAEKKRIESPTPPEDKTVIWVDTSNPDNVVWKIWSETDGKWKAGPSGPQGPRGLQGLQGEDGDQGIPGTPGQDGRTAYTHIAYADDEEGNGFTQSSANKEYVGMYADHTQEDSTNPADYNWTRIKGQDGAQGIPGPKGADGQTPYFHTAWANNSSGSSGFSTTVSEGKLYIGTYTDFTAADSSDPSKYNWTKIKGEKGDQGEKGETGLTGPPGEDGQTLYTWLKYADSPTSGMSDSPTGKEYIGLAYNKTSPNESTNFSDYTWAKTKGDQGVQGPAGADGTPRYTWTKYADDENGNGLSDSPEEKRYLGLAYNKTSASESSNPSDYSWSPLYDNVKPGGRNLIVNSQTKQNMTNIKDVDKAVLEENGEKFTRLTALTSSAYAYFWEDYKFQLNKEYVVSADIRSSTTGQIRYGIRNDAAEGYEVFYPYVDNPSNGEWVRVQRVFKYNNEYDRSLVLFGLTITGDILDVKNVQIEKGNVSMDYREAPEDDKKYVDDTAENINKKLNNAVTTIDGSGVTVKDGGFFLEDDVTDMKYSATPRRNIVKDHSFELVKVEVGSIGQGAIDHNWLDMRMSDNNNENIWLKTGSPKVAVVFAPDNRSALPIFGEKAICVRNANFVRQIIYDGVAAGMTFTASGFFKRQHTVVTGGQPRFEIDHLDAAGGFKARLTNTIFPAVPNDYSVVRHSLTFTIPRNFLEGDSLDFKISGGNSEWVQCDGIQIVEGSYPSIYMPEDSTWEIAKGRYYTVSRQPSLWTGHAHLRADDTIFPTKPITDCNNGWIFVWGYWSIDNGAVGNSDWQFTHIPKQPTLYNGGGHRTGLRAGGSNLDIVKYYYIYHDRIVGHNLSYTGDNRHIVLREILEY